MKTSADVAALQAAVESARQALAASQAHLAELLVATEPTDDLAAEEKLAAELTIKQTALERVITAQRKRVQDAEAALLEEIGPMLRAELAQINAEAEAKLQEAGQHLWAAHKLIAGLSLPAHDRIADIRRRLQDAGAIFPSPVVMQLQAAESGIAAALTKMGLALPYAGPGGAGIMPAPSAAERQVERERQKQQTAGWFATLRRRRELEELEVAKAASKADSHLNPTRIA